MRIHRAIVAVLFLVACTGRPRPEMSNQGAGSSAGSVKEGQLAVPDGQLWYRVTGAGSATPVILLHGGPGYSSFYLRLFDSLGRDRPTIRYDQLGGGKSSRVSDTLVMTIPHFVRELDSVRAALGADQVYLLGHSWGTILAVEYYRAHPSHVAGLILGSAALDIPEWERHARVLVDSLPGTHRDAIRRVEKTRDFAAAEYQVALGEFYGRYVWRRPVQADLDSTLQTMNEAIYNYMQGPSEFTITGTLRRYDATSLLPTIQVPTLYTVGEFDEANPATIRRFASLTPHAQFAEIAGAAHLTTWDNPTSTLAVVRTFLLHADSVRAALH